MLAVAFTCGRSTGCRTQGFSASFCKRLHYSQPQKAQPDNASHRFLLGEARLTLRLLSQAGQFSGLCAGLLCQRLGRVYLGLSSLTLAQGGTGEQTEKVGLQGEER